MVKNRLSKFELLKCCRIFQQWLQTDFASNKELFKCCSEFSFQYKMDYCTIELTSAAKLTVLFVRKKGSQISDGPSRANLQSLQNSLLW